jgi:CheY-like chemotaxis protein
MAGNSVILLVDDDEDSIVLLETALERAEVANRRVVAHNGKEAIAYLNDAATNSDPEKFPWPGLMLLDLKMPGMDGFAVLEWCRRFEEGKELTIVVMTASNNDSDHEKALSLGAVAYFVKPLNFKELVEMTCEIRDRWLKKSKKR